MRGRSAPARALPDPVVLARLGGDEFVALLAAADERAARAAACDIEKALEPSLSIDGVRVHVQASIALAPEHGSARTELLRHADVAMYRAKHRATGVELYDHDHDQASRATLVLAGELRDAIPRASSSCTGNPGPTSRPAPSPASRRSCAGPPRACHA